MGPHYQGRAIAYFQAQDFDNAWADVNKIKSLGMGDNINPGFLEALKKASGRDK